MFILLDLDGVMVTTPPWKQVEELDDHFSKFSPKAAGNLQRIITETEASIVLTTSHKSRFSNKEWKDIFHKRGVLVHSISKLSDNTENLSRKAEILNWLEKEVHDNFVILDDDKSLYDLPSFAREKCIITSPLIGLDEVSAVNAIQMLNNTAKALSDTSKSRVVD
jgi:hypothetical protein